METQTAQPRLRRAYFECRHGQLHVHNAIPAGGGFDEQTTLLCLHASGATGRSFLPVSTLLGMSRSVYSPDLPGCGESDGPAIALSIAGNALAIGDFIDSMRFRQLDLLGVNSGAAIAAELAIARPKVVRKVVMVGAPAQADWQAANRLPLVTQPLLLLRPRDASWEAGGQVTKILPGAKVVDLPEQDQRILETGAALVVKQLSEFL